MTLSIPGQTVDYRLLARKHTPRAAIFFVVDGKSVGPCPVVRQSSYAVSIETGVNWRLAETPTFELTVSPVVRQFSASSFQGKVVVV